MINYPPRSIPSTSSLSLNSTPTMKKQVFHAIEASCNPLNSSTNTPYFAVNASLSSLC